MTSLTVQGIKKMRRELDNGWLNIDQNWAYLTISKDGFSLANPDRSAQRKPETFGYYYDGGPRVINAWYNLGPSEYDYKRKLSGGYGATTELAVNRWKARGCEL